MVKMSFNNNNNNNNNNNKLIWPAIILRQPRRICFRFIKQRILIVTNTRYKIIYTIYNESQHITYYYRPCSDSGMLRRLINCRIIIIIIIIINVKEMTNYK